MTTEWTELAYLELQAGNTAMIVFAFAVVMVFLVLAAQYESWSLPLAIILVVPMCLLSAVVGVNIANEDINIFTQIGFVVLVGLASKNAILIVEFAKQRRDAGESRRRDAEGLLAPAPADHHDLVRLHPRRVPAPHRPRGRGRDAADAGDHGVQRDARRDDLRDLPDAGLLLRDRLAGRDRGFFAEAPVDPVVAAGDPLSILVVPALASWSYLFRWRHVPSRKPLGPLPGSNAEPRAADSEWSPWRSTTTDPPRRRRRLVEQK